MVSDTIGTRGPAAKADRFRTRIRIHIPNKYKLFLMALPFLVLVAVFSYAPLFGWLIAFFDYKPGLPLNSGNFVGFKWFRSIASNPVQTGEILRVMRNTVAMSLINIATSVLPVAFAIFLSEVRAVWFKKGVQILTTLPNFISWVLVYSFAFALFSVDNGFINQVLKNIGAIDRGIQFLATDKHVWLTMTAWHLWKGLGWGAIMYLAAIAGIDQELYEAAVVDGANRWDRIRFITWPSIKPTVVLMLILNCGSILNAGFDQIFNMMTDNVRNVIDIFDTFIYRYAFQMGQNLSLTIAAGMFKSVINFVLLLIANQSARWLGEESLL